MDGYLAATHSKKYFFHAKAQRVASLDDNYMESQTWSAEQMKELSEDNTVYRIIVAQTLSAHLHSIVNWSMTTAQRSFQVWIFFTLIRVNEVSWVAVQSKIWIVDCSTICMRLEAICHFSIRPAWYWLINLRLPLPSLNTFLTTFSLSGAWSNRVSKASRSVNRKFKFTTTQTGDDNTFENILKEIIVPCNSSSWERTMSAGESPERGDRNDNDVRHSKPVRFPPIENLTLEYTEKKMRDKCFQLNHRGM